jgi:hypothetical protein
MIGAFMNSKICVNCAKENEEHFTYCKYCGTMLPVVDKQPEQNLNSTQAENYHCNTDEKISPLLYRIYIGPGSEGIGAGFEKLQKKGSTISFYIPVFFLGIIFGIYGIAAWFLSRGMKKLGFLLLFTGVAFTFADGFINLDLNRELCKHMLLAFSGDGAAAENLSYNLTLYSQRALSIGYYADIIFSFLSGFFALFFYKKQADRDIMQICSTHVEDYGAPLDIKIKLAGGRKNAMVLFPIIFYILSNIFAFVVTVI